MRQTMNENWKFVKYAENMSEAVGAAGEHVDLPHTWNAADGQDGGNDYYRGICWYVKELGNIVKSGDEEIYLEIPGAAMIGEVYLNGEKLYRHEGGYSLFRVNLTEKLQEKNVIAVSVDNRDNTVCYPQKADFTFYGGLYRGSILRWTTAEHRESR